MKNYRLYDVLEGKDLIAEVDTLKQVAEVCNHYALECDDECNFLLYKLNAEKNKYKLIKDWTYNKNTVTINGLL